jgi:hypothetical protein
MVKKWMSGAFFALILMLAIFSINPTVSAYQPTVMTYTPYSTANNSTILQGRLTDDGAQTCLVWFEWGQTVSYGNKTTNQSKNNGDYFYENITGLSPVTIYHYRAAANNTDGTSYGNDTGFMTRPNGPSNMNVAFSTTYVNLTWTKGFGANATRIQRKLGAYPEDIVLSCMELC